MGTNGYDSKYYDEGYFTRKGCKGWYDDTAFSLDNEWHKKWTDFVISILGIKQGQSVLDVGCALGNVVKLMNDKNIDAWGIDISEYAIENRHHERCTRADITDDYEMQLSYIKRDINAIDKFDYIICRETIEHIKDYNIGHVLYKFLQLTKKGGILLLSPATNRAGKEDLKQANHETRDESHLCIKPPYWWVDALRRQGWNVDLELTYKISGFEMPLKYNWDLIIAKNEG